MESVAVTDETCAAFGRLGQLEGQAVHRLVVGEDRAPHKLSRDEAAAELGDPFATLLLLQGTFPTTAIGVFEALDQAASADDPLRQQMSFLVGEGMQLEDVPEIASRDLRFIVTRGAGAEGPDLMVSVSHPQQKNAIELMAWDREHGGFNYYRTVGEDGAWVFAGNSRHAVTEGTEGKGPFESHTSGNFLMKELQTPWINWDSPAAPLPESIFPAGDERVNHPWFLNRERLGAITCEKAVARASIGRWTRVRFEGIVDADGIVDRPRRIMQQILGTPTANLASSHIESDTVANRGVDLPPTFFVDQDAFKHKDLEDLGLPLPPPPGFPLPGAMYTKALETFEVHLDDDRGFTRPRDTHFAFVVPERAAEDIAVLAEAHRIGLISDRLAACLLMTDFANPVFSQRREALLAHVPESASIVDGASTFSEEMANAIVAAAEGTPEGSGEREFAERWGVGEEWRTEFPNLLNAYYEAVRGQLTDQEAFNDYFRLAETRRERFRAFPIGSEFALLFARSNVESANREMQADGTVVNRG